MKTNIVKFMTFAWVVALAACGTVKHNAEFTSSFAQRQAVSVEVGGVIDAAPKDKRGKYSVFDIAAYLHVQLDQELKESGLGPTGNAKPYVLTATITEYEPGDADKRWLLPGYGSTVATVECELLDGSEKVGSISAHRSVDFGGLYTANAWESVFKSLAKDIVGEIKDKLKQRH